MKKQFLEAGKIVNTHGVTGDIKVQSWCDTPDVLTTFDTLYLSPEKPVKVKKSYVHKGCVIMHLAGVVPVKLLRRCAIRCCILTAMTSICPKISYLFRI